MYSKTPSLIPDIPFLSHNTHPSKVLSTLLSSATNNPLTFILGKVHNPAKLLGVFTFPIPVSFPFRRFLIAGAKLLLLIGLIVTGSVLGVIDLWVLIIALGPIWVPTAMAVLVMVLGLLSVCGLGLVVAAAMACVLQRFFTTHNPLGWDQKRSNAKKGAPGAPFKNQSTMG